MAVGRGPVREAVCLWLENGDLPHLKQVFRSPPKIVNEVEFFASPAFPKGEPGVVSGVISYFHIEHQAEKLISYPVVDGGWKYRYYNILLMNYMRSNERDTYDAQVANDEFLDALTARIASSPNEGNAEDIFAAGIGLPATTDDWDVLVDCDLPKVHNQGAFMIFSTVRFVVTQAIQPMSQT